MTDLIEYRVRSVERFIVTRFSRTASATVYGEEKDVSSSSQHGEFDNFETAYAVAYALCKAEHQQLGYAVDDERIQYPLSHPPGTVMSLCPSFHSQEEIEAVGSQIVNKEGELEELAKNG